MTTFSFQPDAAAVPGLPWNVTYLSQRDVTSNIPINFVTRPGVSLTAACFAHNRYEVNATAKCVSNLLAAGFGRWDIDLYWDRNSRGWTFCPVEIPAAGVYPVTPTTTSATSSNVNQTTSLRAGELPTSTTSGPRTTLQQRKDKAVEPRATTSSTSSTTTPNITSTLTAFTSTSANSSYIVLPTPQPGVGEPLYQVGPYTCSRNLGLSTLISILANFLDTTDNTLEAYLYYFTFNLHLAASYQDPTTIPNVANIDQLPNPSGLLSSIFSSEFSLYLYTPMLLVQQRQNLNTSWLGITESQQPATSYFTLDPIPYTNNDFSTPDGWPSQSFLEIDKQRRLLVSLGSIDDNMQNYNISGDSGIIWRNNAFENSRSVILGTNDRVTSGCLFDPSTASIQAQNTSWATTIDPPELALDSTSTTINNITIPAIANITACGISPLLNQTLSNTTADIDPGPYVAFVHSSIWSWANGQPDSASEDDDSDDEDMRCALLDTTSGHWRVANCDLTYHGACRTIHAPYHWRITTLPGHYRYVNATCPAGTTFATPRTALENAYLLNALRTSSFASETAIWLNFNSIEVDACWVVGVGTTCPYQGNVSTTQTVTVPAVSGVIILVLAALMVVVKCGANRRNSRRTGTREGGMEWEYEGLPA